MIKTCKRCKKEFDSNGHYRVYCSRNCQRNANASMDIISKRAKASQKYTTDLRILYDCKCACCGWFIDEKKLINGNYNHNRGCVIHHIIPVKDGGTDEATNLIMLCPNCHALAHAGIIKEDELAKKIPQNYHNIISIKKDKMLSDCAYRIAKAIDLN